MVLPNVILLNAGTNDCKKGDKMASAGSMADYVNFDDAADACVRKLNVGLKRAVDDAADDGQKMGWVDV
jgi:hypothetical protein